MSYRLHNTDHKLTDKDGRVFWWLIDYDKKITCYHRAGGGPTVEVNCVLELNVDNPEVSIERIKKLQVLK